MGEHASVWDVAGRKLIRTFNDAAYKIGRVALSKDGKRALTCGHEKVVRIWNVQEGKEIGLFQGHQGQVHSVALAPDDRRVLTSDDTRVVCLWDVETGKVQSRLPAPTVSPWCIVSFLPDGRRALFAGAETGDKMILCDLENSKEVRQLPFSTYQIALTADGRTGLASWGHALHVFDVETGDVRRTIAAPRPSQTVALSPDGRRCVAGNHEGVIRLWDVVAGKELRPLQGPDGPTRDLAFSPADDKSLATVGTDGVLRVWDLAEGASRANGFAPKKSF